MNNELYSAAPPSPQPVAEATDAMVEAWIKFASDASYLQHPQVAPYMGTKNGDSGEAWHRRYVKAAINTVLATTPAAALQPVARPAAAEVGTVAHDVWQERVACARIADDFADKEGAGERRYSGNVISARILARTNTRVEPVEHQPTTLADLKTLANTQPNTFTLKASGVLKLTDEIDRLQRELEVARRAANGTPPQPVARQDEAGALPNHVIRETVNQLRDIALQYHGAQQLRSRIQDLIVPLLSRTTPAIEPVAGLTDADIERIWQAHVVPVFGMNGINANVFARAIERHITGQAGATGESK